MFIISDRRVTLLTMGQELPSLPDAALHPLMQGAEQAMKIFARAGNLEGELRARMLLADLFELAGQQAAARSLAEYVLPRARAMGYARVESLAQDHLAGGSLLRQVETRIRQGPGEDDDHRLAAADDEEMRRFANDCLAAAGLPEERLPIVERECYSLRDAAREHVQWCRHLELLQDLRHTRHPSTHSARSLIEGFEALGKLSSTTEQDRALEGLRRTISAASLDVERIALRYGVQATH